MPDCETRIMQSARGGRVTHCITAVLLCVAAPASAQAPAQLQLTETLRIGSLDRENYDLSWVIDLAVAEDGTLFVAQPLLARRELHGRRHRAVPGR